MVDSHVMCDVGEKSYVLIGRCVDDKLCRDKPIRLPWFHCVGRFTHLRHLSLQPQVTCIPLRWLR